MTKTTMTAQRFGKMCANEKLGCEIRFHGETWSVGTYRLHDGTEDECVHVRSNTTDPASGVVEVEALTELGALALELYAGDAPITHRLHGNMA